MWGPEVIRHMCDKSGQKPKAKITVKTFEKLRIQEK